MAQVDRQLAFGRLAPAIARWRQLLGLLALAGIAIDRFCSQDSYLELRPRASLENDQVCAVDARRRHDQGLNAQPLSSAANAAARRVICGAKVRFRKVQGLKHGLVS